MPLDFSPKGVVPNAFFQIQQDTAFSTSPCRHRPNDFCDFRKPAQVGRVNTCLSSKNKNSKLIWSGDIGFKGKPNQQNQIPSFSIPCSILTTDKSKEIELCGNCWPSLLSLRLIPESFVRAGNLHKFFVTSKRRVLFQFAQDTEQYRALTALMTGGMVGIIRFRERAETRILLLMKTPGKRRICGIFTNDPDGLDSFVNRMYDMHSNHLILNQQEQQAADPKDFQKDCLCSRNKP